MKTVLAPNAPWPVWEEDGKPQPKPKPRPKPRPKPKKPPSKMQKTNAKFDEWADKNLVRKFK